MFSNCGYFLHKWHTLVKENTTYSLKTCDMRETINVVKLNEKKDILTVQDR